MTLQSSLQDLFDDVTAAAMGVLRQIGDALLGIAAIMFQIVMLATLFG